MPVIADREEAPFTAGGEAAMSNPVLRERGLAVARQASRRGLALGAASAALLFASGAWLAFGSLSTSCVSTSQVVGGGAVATTSSACSSAASNYESHGLAFVAWLAVPGLVAVFALLLTPLARLRAPARWAVVVLMAPAALLMFFTPFMLLLMAAAALMALAAVFADAPDPVQPLLGA